MVWSVEAGGGCEAAKIAPIVVPYLQGRALDIGSGPGKVWPMVIGIDRITQDGRPITDMAIDGTKLDMFTDASVDAVFSSYLLQEIPREKVGGVLEEWTRVLRIGGHLVLYLPSATFYPNVDEKDAPPRLWDIAPGDIEQILKAYLVGRPFGWDLILSEDRGRDDEYSLLIVLRKTVAKGAWAEKLWERNPGGKKRALVIRYGAIGDAVVCASVFPGLKKQGYHLTVNTQPRIEEVLRHDPFVDEWMIQETDYVPNMHLGPYWQGISKRYDKVINLSESVEGLLLALPGRLNHGYTHGARRRVYDHINYLEHTHNIADVPHDFSGSRFYPTEEETQWALGKKYRFGKGNPVIVWCVNGSSNHKVYPFTQIAVRWLLERTPATVVLYGDPGVGKELANAIISVLKDDGVVDTARIHNIAGDWEIRRSLTFAIHADVVVGPETGPLNSVSMEDVPKVIYLSHSSPDNLTKHWRNTVTLTPDTKDVPCWPCHMLHYTWEFCHRDEKTSAALCASHIKPERIFKEICLKIGAMQLT